MVLGLLRAQISTFFSFPSVFSLSHVSLSLSFRSTSVKGFKTQDDLLISATLASFHLQRAFFQLGNVRVPDKVCSKVEWKINYFGAKPLIFMHFSPCSNMHFLWVFIRSRIFNLLTYKVIFAGSDEWAVDVFGVLPFNLLQRSYLKYRDWDIHTSACGHVLLREFNCDTWASTLQPFTIYAWYLLRMENPWWGTQKTQVRPEGQCFVIAKWAVLSKELRSLLIMPKQDCSSLSPKAPAP